MDVEGRDEKKRITRIRRKTALVAAALLVPLDVLLEVLCVRFSLVFYLIVAGLGYSQGTRVARWLENTGFLSRAIRTLGVFVVFVGVVGAGFLSTYSPPENSKCYWRYCGRMIGPGLFKSPFLAPPISCRFLSTCFNEYPYSRSEGKTLHTMSRELGCPAP